MHRFAPLTFGLTLVLLLGGPAALAPDARLVVAERSGHYVQLDEPELVIEAIRQVAAAVRDPSTWTS